MERLIDVLPGLPMAVDAVTETLAQMWDAGSKSVGPVDFRASQLNLILHFGLKTTSAEAEELFNRAIQFAQKYPCRIVVLCPEEDKKEGVILEGKLFSQCYIGKTMRDLCCCEALILGYSIEESDFLENQVSLWVESDLPIYHWFHRVPAERIKTSYMSFLKRCRRVLFDSEIEGANYCNISWPESTRCSDLVVARNLPFRQQIGQFLSSFEPESLVEGLKSISVETIKGKESLASKLCDWQIQAINRALKLSEKKISLKADSKVVEGNTLQIHWTYENPDKFFHWEYDCTSKSGRVTIQLNNQKVEHAMHIEPLSEQSVLSEGLFFG